MLKLDLRPEAFAGVRFPSALSPEAIAKKAQAICDHFERMLRLAEDMRRNPDPDIRRAGEELRAKVRAQLDAILARKEGVL